MYILNVHVNMYYVIMNGDRVDIKFLCTKHRQNLNEPMP
jgi:hypothetical protein